jgi:hypothetical protein
MSGTRTALEFKRCGMCNQEWARREELLADPQVNFLGYQAGVRNLQPEYFLFAHSDCENTLAISPERLQDLAFATSPRIAAPRATARPAPRRFRYHLSPWSTRCENLLSRTLLRVITGWPKHSA